MALAIQTTADQGYNRHSVICNCNWENTEHVTLHDTCDYVTWDLLHRIMWPWTILKVWQDSLSHYSKGTVWPTHSIKARTTKVPSSGELCWDIKTFSLTSSVFVVQESYIPKFGVAQHSKTNGAQNRCAMCTCTYMHTFFHMLILTQGGLYA